MRKSIVAAVAALSLVAGAGAANAKSGPGDDNPNNDKGQCTAFFNGQKNGHEDPSNAELNDIYGECGSLIGGNPTHGRFPSCFDDVDNSNGDPCDEGESPA